MAVAVFDPVAFKARYAEFSNVNNTLLSSCFTEAGIYLTNNDFSPVQDVTRRTLLLNMLTAHIAFLGGALSADGQARPVGRVSQAGQGSVSAGFEYSTPTAGSSAWFNQSAYGAAFWQATTNLRGFQYRARPTCFR